MADFRFQKSRRLLKPAQFERVFERRHSQADGVLIVYGCPNDLDYSRLGLAVSRKVGGAVARNRWKRLVREAFRLAGNELPNGWDFVVLPRASRAPAMLEVKQSLIALVARLERRSQPTKAATSGRDDRPNPIAANDSAPDVAASADDGDQRVTRP